MTIRLYFDEDSLRQALVNALRAVESTCRPLSKPR